MSQATQKNDSNSSCGKAHEETQKVVETYYRSQGGYAHSSKQGGKHNEND